MATLMPDNEPVQEQGSRGAGEQGSAAPVQTAATDAERNDAADQPPTTNDQPPTTNDQPPTTNDQPPTSNDQPPTTDNEPYPGPRTFKRDERDRFFGRDREARDLTALILAHRLVLFYAQSGAGKSSLINTQVIPTLADSGFEVLPVGSVKGRSGFEVSADNIYLYNLLTSLVTAEKDEGGRMKDEGGRMKDESDSSLIPHPSSFDFGSLSLSHFLDNLVCDGERYAYDPGYVWAEDSVLKPRVLIIDQFEEIFTFNTAFWRQREEFFHQLGRALREDEHLWVLLTMREDFIANLDPYLHYLPDGLRHRFYMQQLRRPDALAAIANPVAHLRRFEPPAAGRPGAADFLVDNLLAINDPQQTGHAREAQFVEPVQLQVVAYQLWQKLKTRPGPTITRQDVIDFADVDRALTGFYEDTIAAAVRETGVTEVALRHWFDHDLLTEAGTRNLVYRGDELTGSLPTAAADFIRTRLLVREVVRPAGIWFELIHDRFVQPVREANRAWRQSQPLLLLAGRWAADRDNPGLLLPADQLALYAGTDEQRAAIHALGPDVDDYIEASRAYVDAQAKAAADAQAATRERTLRRIIAGAVVLFVVLSAALLTTIFSLNTARVERAAAEDERATAQSAQAEAVAQAGRAARERASAVAAQATAESTLLQNRALLAENEALRLADKALSYLDASNNQAALLLSSLAQRQATTSLGQAILFRAANARLDPVPGSDLQTGLRREYTLPEGPGARGQRPGEEAISLAPGPAAGSLAIITGAELLWWPVERPAAASPITLDAPLQLAAFATSHGLLAGAAGPDLRLWRYTAGAWQPVALSGGGAAGVSALAFSADGRRLAAARCDGLPGDKAAQGVIELWHGDPQTAAFSLETTIAARPCAGDVAFLDRDGARLVWVGPDTVMIENLTTATARLAPGLVGAAYSPRRLAIAPDSRWLVILSCVEEGAGEEGAGGQGPGTTEEGSSPTPGPSPLAPDPSACKGASLDWWNLTEEDAPIPLTFTFTTAAAPTDVAYLPVRDEFVVLYDDGRLIGWSAAIAGWQANACALAGRNLTAAEWQNAFPALSFGDYRITCPAYGVHRSVTEALVRQCRPDRLAEARAQWAADPRLAAQTGLAGFDEWAAGLLIDALAVPDTGVADACRPILAALDLPGATAALLDDEQRHIVRLAPDDPRQWALQGRAGDVVHAGAVSLSGDAPRLELLGDDGAILAGSADGSGVEFQLPTDGRYRLALDPATAADTIALSAQRIAPRPITLGQTVENVDPALGRWTFQGLPGRLVTFDVAALPADATLSLRDSTGADVAVNDDYQSALNPHLEYILQSQDLYTLQVGWIGDPATYSLRSSLTEPILLTDDVTGLPATAGRRLWQFDAQAGDFLTLGLTAQRQGDAGLSLYDSDGLFVLSNQDRDEGVRDPEIATLILTSGAYYALVEWPTTPPEAYQLSLSRVPAMTLPLDGTPQTATAEQRAWRFTATAGNALTIVLTTTLATNDAGLTLFDPTGQPIASGLIEDDFTTRLSAVLPHNGDYLLQLDWLTDPAGYTLAAGLTTPRRLTPAQTQTGIGLDQPIWAFSGDAGDPVRVVLQAQVPGAALELYGGGLLLAQGVVGDDLSVTLETILPAAGDVYAAISPGPTDPGGHTLTVNPAQPETVTADTPVAANPDRRLWRFEGRAGTTITARVEAQGEFDPILSLLDSQGVVLATADDSEGRNPVITFELPADGVYFLQVGWFGITMPGPYTLSVVEE